MTTRYLTCAETAKLIRKALKRAFPVSVRFSVRSSVYSGGASIDVRWTDGPTEARVTEIVGQYAGSRFDGMIDLKTHHTSWLLPDGTAVTAKDPGDSGVERIDNPIPHDDAQLVSFGADFVFTTRDYSPAFWAAAAREIGKRYGVKDVPTRKDAPAVPVDAMGGMYFDQLVWRYLKHVPGVALVVPEHDSPPFIDDPDHEFADAANV